MNFLFGKLSLPAVRIARKFTDRETLHGNAPSADEHFPIGQSNPSRAAAGQSHRRRQRLRVPLLRLLEGPLGRPGLGDPAGTASTIRPTCITAMLCARHSTTRSQRLAVASVEPLPAKRGLALNAGDAAQQLQDALAEGRRAAAGYADPVMRWRTCLSDNVVQTGGHL